MRTRKLNPQQQQQQLLLPLPLPAPAARSARQSKLSCIIWLLLLVPFSAQVNRGQSRVVITKKRITIVRTGPIVKAFPERKIATVSYPVVSGLSNAGALRRIRSILRLKNIFDSSLQDYRQNSWLDDFTYVVKHNGNYILDITFTQSGVGAYPDSQSRNFTISLKTGSVLTPTNVFIEDKLPELAKLVDKELQAQVAELIKAAQEDKYLEDPTPVVEALSKLQFSVSNLSDFSVSKKGLTFLYDAGFPHVIEALQPDGQYVFDYSKLRPFIKPDGPLSQFVREK
jgi:hypothetical protein